MYDLVDGQFEVTAASYEGMMVSAEAPLLLAWVNDELFAVRNKPPTVNSVAKLSTMEFQAIVVERLSSPVLHWPSRRIFAVGQHVDIRHAAERV